MPCQHMCSSGNLSDKGWALSPRDLVRQLRGPVQMLSLNLVFFPRHLLKQNIFKGQAAIKPLLLITKSSAWWLRHKVSLLLSRHCRQHVSAIFICTSIWTHPLLLVHCYSCCSSGGLTLKHACPPACPFWVLCIDFYRFRWICTVLYKNSSRESW